MGNLGAFATVGGVTLTAGRESSALVVAGNRCFVIGGKLAAGGTASIEQMRIDTGSALQPFADAGTHLLSAREFHGAAVVGNNLYVMGGEDSTQQKQSVERAPIAADGTVGAFVGAGNLDTRRSRPCVVLLGDWLYVIGGYYTAPLATIARAKIGADGTLGSFANAGVTLAQARWRHACAVGPGTVWVTGGVTTGTTPEKTTEKATVAADGTLGNFALSGVLLYTARAYYSTAVLGSKLWAVGGYDGSVALDSVEYSTFDGSGGLSIWTQVVGVTLADARRSFFSVVRGNSLFVWGGGVMAIERSTIAQDGTLGTFMTMGNSSDFADGDVVQLGNFLYLPGGYDGSAETTKVLRAEMR